MHFKQTITLGKLQRSYLLACGRKLLLDSSLEIKRLLITILSQASLANLNYSSFNDLSSLRTSNQFLKMAAPQEKTIRDLNGTWVMVRDEQLPRYREYTDTTAEQDFI